MNKRVSFTIVSIFLLFLVGQQNVNAELAKGTASIEITDNKIVPTVVEQKKKKTDEGSTLASLGEKVNEKLIIFGMILLSVVFISCFKRKRKTKNATIIMLGLFSAIPFSLKVQGDSPLSATASIQLVEENESLELLSVPDFHWGKISAQEITSTWNKMSENVYTKAILGNNSSTNRSAFVVNDTRELGNSYQIVMKVGELKSLTDVLPVNLFTVSSEEKISGITTTHVAQSNIEIKRAEGIVVRTTGTIQGVHETGNLTSVLGIDPSLLKKGMYRGTITYRISDPKATPIAP